MMNRRQFLNASLKSMTYFSAMATTPSWIVQSAQALGTQCLASDRILVIVQLAGGNDGLNTVIPRTDPVYYDAATRPTIRVPAGAELNLDGLNGLHPRLSRLANWYQQGRLAIVQNVGYVNPNLSHFTGTDFWEYGYITGDPAPAQGWAARFFDNHCSGMDADALTMVAAGISTVPNTLIGVSGYTPPAIADPANYALNFNADAPLRQAAITALNNVATADPEIDFLQRSENVAEASIADIATASALGSIVLPGTYSADSLGEGLQLVSQIIRAGFPTNIFYVNQSGYDTHGNQVNAADPLNAGDHPVLLDALDRSLDAFLSEMELSGNLDRVVLITFSEFGRRVAENGSAGTDHGAANCLFVAGGQVNGGVYGGQPDLVNLIKGNLPHAIDFRSVYTRVIESWFEADASAVFGSGFYGTIAVADLPQIEFIRARNAVKRANWKYYQ